MNIIKALKITGMVAFMGIGMAMPFIMIVAHSTSTPDVIFSYSTKQCVRVEMPDGTRGNCANLPKKYNHIWGR